jgi:hypothetical protein
MTKDWHDICVILNKHHEREKNLDLLARVPSDADDAVCAFYEVHARRRTSTINNNKGKFAIRKGVSHDTIRTGSLIVVVPGIARLQQ